MRRYQFVTVDVFTSKRFGGNPLAVFPEAAGLSDSEMQSLAAEFNLSETTFVLPPKDSGCTARVRIFNRQHEMAFAGHPNVGTGFVLAQQQGEGRNALLFEQLAGPVEVNIDRDAMGQACGASIAAPRPLSVGVEIAPRDAAACAGLEEADVITASHPPVQASMGNPFVFCEVHAQALSRARPDIAAFQQVVARYPGLEGRLALFAWCRDSDRLRARMFAPLTGTWEDPATGSAAAPLAGLLLSLSGQESSEYEIHQGLEIRRPSLLRTTARRAPDGIRATVGGSCVPMFSGEVRL